MGLDSIGSFKPHQCERTKSDSLLPSILPGCPVQQDNQNSIRQFCSLVLFEENGFSSFFTPRQCYKGFDFILSPKKHFFCACPHSRFSECACRPGFTSGSSCHRVDVGPDLFESICLKVSPFPQVDLFNTRATAWL